MSTGETRALRIAYVRLAQASMAIWLEKLEDEELGGVGHLDAILEHINGARSKIEAAAAAEGIDLVGPDE